MEVIASLAMLREVWRHIDWRLVRHLCIGAFAGAPVGIYMLLHFSENAVRVFISLCVLLAAVAMLGGFQLQAKRGMPATVAVGVLSGLVNGVGAVGGLPVVLFMLAAGTSAAMIRASIVVFFLINDTYASTINVFTGVLTFQTLLWVAVLFVPLTVGVLIGSRQFSARSPASFRRMALWLLVLLSIAGLVRTVAG